MPDHKTIALSQLLDDLCRGEGERVSLRQMVDHFGHRAFGAVLFTFAVPNALPLPPGSSGVLGLPLVLVAPQLALGMKSLWLPRWLGEKTIERKGLERGLGKLLPSLQRLERVSKPRYTQLFGPVGDRFLGLVVFLLSLVLILPIPFGNMLPAAAIAVLAFALVQRDGALAAVGYLMASASVLVLVFSFRVVLAAGRQLLSLFGA